MGKNGKTRKAKRKAFRQHLTVDCRGGRGAWNSPNGFLDERQVMWLCHTWKSGRTEDSDTMYIHIERGSARCFMEILIRKVENNRETNKRVEGRQNEWSEREIVWELELGILGKQIKFTFC